MISRLNLKALFILFALVSSVVVAQEDATDSSEEADEDNVEEVITLGSKIARDPLESAQPITILDGDVVRQNLSKGLGFSREDRSTNVRRIGYVASDFVKHKGIVICANIAPYDNDRRFNRELIEKYGKYVEVMVGTSLETCEDRDIKGLYKLAREGKIKEFTGISDPFEDSSKLDVMISGTNLDDDIQKIMECI